MEKQDKFQIVGPGKRNEDIVEEKKAARKLPYVSLIILGLIVLGCLCADLISNQDASYMDLMNYSKAPCRQFLFGTDNLGRDLFSCICMVVAYLCLSV